MIMIKRNRKNHEPLLNFEAVTWLCLNDLGFYRSFNSFITGFYMIGTPVMKELTHFVPIFDHLILMSLCSTASAAEYKKVLKKVEHWNKTG